MVTILSFILCRATGLRLPACAKRCRDIRLANDPISCMVSQTSFSVKQRGEPHRPVAGLHIAIERINMQDGQIMDPRGQEKKKTRGIGLNNLTVQTHRKWQRSPPFTVSRHIIQCFQQTGADFKLSAIPASSVFPTLLVNRIVRRL